LPGPAVAATGAPRALGAADALAPGGGSTSAAGAGGSGVVPGGDTIGAVVAEYPDTALVEISTESEVREDGLPGRELLDDLVTVPYDALHVVQPAAATTG